MTVVKQLLGHDNAGAVKPNPVDFVVAITHNHGDHTGKAAAMAPRTVYFPDGDWPNNAPAHYVPIREGGGLTARGTIAAAGVDLGDRYIEAVNQAGTPPGSTGYLDRENKMLATGDAYGSAYVYGHGGTPTSTWVPVMEKQLQLLRAQYPDIALFPAHFYQIKQFIRGHAPLNGRPLDLQYFEDQFANVKGVLDGTKIGEPYREQNRNTVWTGGASARYTYSLANLYPGGIFGGNGEAGQVPRDHDPRHLQAGRLSGRGAARPGDRQHQDRLLPDPRQRQHVDVPDQGLDARAAGRHRKRDGRHRGLRQEPRRRRYRSTWSSPATTPTRSAASRSSRAARSTGRRASPGVTAPVGSGDVIDLGVDAAGRPASSRSSRSPATPRRA